MALESLILQGVAEALVVLVVELQLEVVAVDVMKGLVVALQEVALHVQHPQK